MGRGTDRTWRIQRLRGGYAIVWIDDDGKRHRHQLSARDRLGAEAEARRRIAAGRTSALNMGAIIAAYLEDRAANGIASTGRMQAAWKALAPSWERLDPAGIDDAMCRTWAGTRRAAAATVRYELGLMRTALKWAERQRLIDRAPAIWMPAPPPRRERHITPAQFSQLLASTQAPHVRLYMILGISTAGRPSAILALRWQQVDFTRGLVHLNPEGRAQTAKGRATVPMTDRAREALEAAWHARTSDWVIELGGRPVASVKKAFQLASQRLGFRVTPYSLRHSAAVWMAESGVSMAEIASYLGHTDSRTTERHYARFSPDYLRKAGAALKW